MYFSLCNAITRRYFNRQSSMIVVIISGLPYCINYSGGFCCIFTASVDMRLCHLKSFATEDVPVFHLISWWDAVSITLTSELSSVYASRFNNFNRVENCASELFITKSI